MKINHYLKSNWDLLNEFESDQSRGAEPPVLQKPIPNEAKITALPGIDESSSPTGSIYSIMSQRRSIRKFTSEAVTLNELSWLLWATQGIEKVFRGGIASLRTVPSGGARHPFETYLFINNVEDLEPGLYRYLPVEHSLVFLGEQIPPEKVSEGCLGQTFCGDCAVCFAWSAIPYRTEWRYGPASHKVIAIDAGHMCQNLYLACTACGLGTCAIGAYDQKQMDNLLGLDGEDEFTIYLAPVGRKN